MFRRVGGCIRIVLAGTAIAVLLALTLTFPAATPAGADEAGRAGTIAARSAKPETMGGLAALYDSGPCADCHRDIFEQWRKSPHAASVFGGGRTAASLRKTVHQGLLQWPSSGVKAPGDVTVKHLAGCAKCHLPQLADASDNVARELVETLDAWQKAVEGSDAAARDRAAGKLSALNIGCLVCHNRNAVIHKLKDGYPAAGAVYGKKEAAHPGSYALVKRGEALGESIFCGQCHGYGPNFELDNPTQCATGYGSYLFTYVQEGGRESCQDCHMRKSRLGHDIRGGSSPAMDNAALGVATHAYGYQFRDADKYVPRVVVDVSLTNRAGHAIPDGGSFSKRLLLEVTASAGDNAAAFYTGTRSYRPVPARFGRGGRMGDGPHESSGVIEDSSLLPFRPVRERFEIAPPAAAAGAVNRIAVRVRVREIESGGDGPVARDWYEFRKEVALESLP